MRTGAAALLCAALLCAAALVAYPLTAFPDSGWPRWMGALALASTGAAIAFRSSLLVAAAGALSISIYLFTLGGSARPEALAAVAGVGILLLVELLDLASSAPGPVERSLLRRRALWIAAASVAGGAVALVAYSIGEVLEAPHPLLFVLAAGCAALALALIATLGSRAVADEP